MDGPSESAPKLVLFESRLRRGCEGEGMGIQVIVAQELVKAAMYIVGAGLGDHVDDRSRVPAVFRIKGIGDDAKLFNTVR